MANTSSAKKAVRAGARKAEVNAAHRDGYKLAARTVGKLLQAEKVNKKEVESAISLAYKKIDKAAKSHVNVISKNKAARLKSAIAEKANLALAK